DLMIGNTHFRSCASKSGSPEEAGVHGFQRVGYTDLERNQVQHLCLQVYARGNFFHTKAIVLQRKDGSFRYVQNLLTFLPGASGAERDLLNLRYELAVTPFIADVQLS